MIESHRCNGTRALIGCGISAKQLSDKKTRPTVARSSNVRRDGMLELSPTLDVNLVGYISQDHSGALHTVGFGAWALGTLAQQDHAIGPGLCPLSWY